MKRERDDVDFSDDEEDAILLLGLSPKKAPKPKKKVCFAIVLVYNYDLKCSF